MRTSLGMVAVAAMLFSVSAPARADENNKLTYFTFSKPVQLPGKTLPAGKYRFELADPQESRRVIKVSSEDGSKQLAMLQTVQYTMRKPSHCWPVAGKRFVTISNRRTCEPSAI